MKLPLTGGCLCGGLRYELASEPRLAYVCHCTDCQHLMGSAFSVAITVPASAFRLTKGEPRRLQKTADSGRIIARWICPDCAGWVTSDPQPGGAPGETIHRIRAGSPDNTSWLRPTAHYWTRSKQPWVVLAESDEVYETQPW